MSTKTVPEMFGENVFDDRVMRAVLSDKVYNSLKKTIDEGAKLDTDVAEQVAAAMRDWALAKGATHFTHWFQPLTGVTAEKHDSFIEPSPDGTLSRASLTLLHSRQAASELLSRQEDIQHGILHLMHSSRIRRSASLRHSALTQAKHSTRRHLCSVLWKLLISRLSVS